MYPSTSAKLYIFMLLPICHLFQFLSAFCSKFIASSWPVSLWTNKEISLGQDRAWRMLFYDFHRSQNSSVDTAKLNSMYWDLKNTQVFWPSWMFIVIFMVGRIWGKWEKWFNISERAKWSKCPSISSSFMGEWVIACLLPDQDQGRHIHHLSGCDPKLYIPKYYKKYAYALAHKMSLTQKSTL